MTSQTPNLVTQFAEIARRYCAWVQDSDGKGNDLSVVRRLLAELHLGALQLPATDCGEDLDAPAPSPTIEETASARLATLPIQEYWEVFDPLDPDHHEPDCRMFANDLFEIWQELRGGLALFEEGHILEATWDWKNGFSTHWGHHLLCAQRAIHSREEGY